MGIQEKLNGSTRLEYIKDVELKAKDKKLYKVKLYTHENTGKVYDRKGKR